MQFIVTTLYFADSIASYTGLVEIFNKLVTTFVFIPLKGERPV